MGIFSDKNKIFFPDDKLESKCWNISFTPTIDKNIDVYNKLKYWERTYPAWLKLFKLGKCTW